MLSIRQMEASAARLAEMSLADREVYQAKLLAHRRSLIVEEIATERQRQIEVEGWTLDHDRAHEDGNLAAAAGCYALNAAGELQPNDFCYDANGAPTSPVQWPWNSEWWKPKGARRDLVRAAALIVAEIERLDRGSS